MVAISFSKKPEFPQMIIDGTKDQTIRPYKSKRFEQIKRIKKLQLYWKQRTKEGFLIANAELTDIFRIVIRPHPLGTNLDFMIFKRSNSDYFTPLYYPMTPKEQEELVRRDGLTQEEFYGLFQDTYGDISSMEFMVIRFKVTDIIPNNTHEFIKKMLKEGKLDGFASEELMRELDVIEEKYRGVN